MAEHDKGYLLPAVVDPDRICVYIRVPNEQRHLAAFWGTLIRLTRWYSWERDSAHTAKDVAKVWLQVVNEAHLEDCVVPPVYRIDPSNPCKIQISTDGGTTWLPWFDPTVCIPAPPDLSHFLVDNPPAGNQNLVESVGNRFAMQLKGFGTTPVFSVNQQGSNVAADIYSIATGQAVLRLGRGTDGSYIVLERDAEFTQTLINGDRTVINPTVSILPTADAAHVGTILNLTASGTENGPYYCLQQTDGSFAWIRLSSSSPLTFTANLVDLPAGGTPTFVVDESADNVLYALSLPPIQAPLTFTANLVDLPAGGTPTFVVDESADNVLYALSLPPIQAPLTFTANLVDLPAGGTPTFVVDESADNVLYALSLPPIQAPLTFSANLVDLPDGGTPTFAVDESADNVLYALSLPPILGRGVVCPDTSLPTATETKHYYLTVDALTTMLPMQLPANNSIRNFSVSGLWVSTNNLDTGATSKVLDGHGDIPGGRGPLGVYIGQLVMRPYLSTMAGFGDPIDPFGAPYAPTADTYIMFQQHAPNASGTGYIGSGQICIQYDIAGVGVLNCIQTATWQSQGMVTAGSLGTGGGCSGVDAYMISTAPSRGSYGTSEADIVFVFSPPLPQVGSMGFCIKIETAVTGYSEIRAYLNDSVDYGDYVDGAEFIWNGPSGAAGTTLNLTLLEASHYPTTPFPYPDVSRIRFKLLTNGGTISVSALSICNE